MVITKISKERNVCIESIVKDEFLDVGTILQVDFEDKPRYFKIIKIEALNFVELKIYAENYGYYNKLNNIDIRKLYGLNIEVVKDEKTITKVKSESRLL